MSVGRKNVNPGRLEEGKHGPDVGGVILAFAELERGPRGSYTMEGDLPGRETRPELVVSNDKMPEKLIGATTSVEIEVKLTKADGLIAEPSIPPPQSDTFTKAFACTIRVPSRASYSLNRPSQLLVLPQSPSQDPLRAVDLFIVRYSESNSQEWCRFFQFQVRSLVFTAFLDCNGPKRPTSAY
jgi:hypothetical protein